MKTITLAVSFGLVVSLGFASLAAFGRVADRSVRGAASGTRPTPAQSASGEKAGEGREPAYRILGEPWARELRGRPETQLSVRGHRWTLGDPRATRYLIARVIEGDRDAAEVLRLQVVKGDRARHQELLREAARRVSSPRTRDLFRELADLARG